MFCNAWCFKRLIILISLWMVHSAVYAQTAHSQEPKSLLILNSYNENEPWVNDMIQPILLHLAAIPSVKCDIYDLNNALVEDSLDFKALTAGVINLYSSPAPSYVVMVGNLAFNMRKAIKDAWGEIPMLLITNNKDYATDDIYFDLQASTVKINSHSRLVEEQKEYDMTAIIIPHYYRQTIDLMVNLLPEMDSFVFLSDSIFSNRRLAREIQAYLREDYPDIRFSWLKANAHNAEIFHNMLITKNQHTGLLLSTWLYGKDSFNEGQMPSTSELKLINSSHNPIFAMHESYISLGVIGGVFPDTKLAQKREIEIIEKMIEGKAMCDIPFYISEESYPCINYRRLTEYGISENSCPPGTVFYSKPATFWEKYFWPTITIIIILLLIFIIFATNITMQRKKIKFYKRNTEFVDNMPIPYSNATIRYDSDNNVSTIAYDIKNSAFDKLLADNVVLDSPFLLFPADFIAPKVTQLISDHKPQVFMYHFEKTDTYYEFILCLVKRDNKNKKQNIDTLDIFAIDVTNRHKMEMKFAKAMHILDFTINVSKLIPWQFDLKRNIIIYNFHMGADANDGDAKDREMPLEAFVENAIHPDDRNTLLNIRDDINAGRIREFSVRLRKIDPEKPGIITWAELVGAVMVMDDDPTRKMVIGSSLDITERVRIQQEMAEALDRANESDRMKSAFLASISHEIRTPLNAIIGFSNVIAHTASPEERLDFCEIINRNNEQLLALINDVLDLAKIESNTVDINYTKTDLNALIDHIEKTMEIKVPNHLRFTAIKGSTECIVEIDPTRLTQIITNMISNACKFTPNGAITFGYDITDTDMLYFYVRDTGIGLSEATREKVFDRFFKHNTFIPGTGLGLSICKNLVEKMGGEIGVESAGEGKGSLFWFTLPYIPCAATPEDLEEQEDRFFKYRIPKSESGKLLKVLIAEDNESNYRLLEHLLHESFEISRAHNGHEAVREFVKQEPDVVLMDINMPGMDGYSALSEIRKLSATVPVIAVTAYVYASDRSKILQFGFNGYVSKPITQKGIIDAIAHAMLDQKKNLP